MWLSELLNRIRREIRECLEIDFLVGPHDAPAPLFDATRLHARRAVDFTLGAEIAGERSTPARH